MSVATETARAVEQNIEVIRRRIDERIAPVGTGFRVTLSPGFVNARRRHPSGFPWGGMLAHGRYVNNLLVDGMLREGKLRGSARVELESRLPMTRLLFLLRDALQALGDAADMLRDLGVTLNALRQDALVAVPVEDAAALLHEIIEYPLLTIAAETRCAHS